MHLVALISPEIFSDIFFSREGLRGFTYLVRAKTVFSQVKNHCVLIIPNQLLPLFYANERLRMLAEAIRSDSQCGVIFGEYRDHGQCFFDDVTTRFTMATEHSCVYSELIARLKRLRLPILLLDDDNSCTKNRCDDCEVDSGCRSEIQIPVFDINNDSILSRSQRLSREAVDLILSGNKKLNQENLKHIALLMAIFYGLHDEGLEKIAKVIVHDGVCRDIESSGLGVDIVAFSLFRAIAFPSSTDKTQLRHKYSIDWHANNPDKFGSFKLFRADVLPPSRSGVGSSGTSRLLLGKLKDSWHVLAFTKGHDFHLDTIKNRTQTAVV